jgi:flagellar basal body-associated protein FliL
LSARKLLRIALAFVGVVLLVASAVAFVQLVSQGWLELPSTAALGVGGAAPAPTAPAAVTKALLYPLAAVLCFVMSGLLTTRGR